MALTLNKNQSISLEKTAGTGLTSIALGLGWDPVKPTGFFSRFMGGGTRSTWTLHASSWTTG